MVLDYILQNWPLILILAAMAISFKLTVFLDRKTIRRYYVLVAEIFLLSIAVFVEFKLVGVSESQDLRSVLMAVRYSATPIIIAQIIYTLVRQLRWFVFVPAILLAGVNVASIFTGIVFSIDGDGALVRGPLGLMPFIAVALYGVFLVIVLYRQSNKRIEEIVPIAFMLLSLSTSLALPFLLGPSYSGIFCANIAIAVFTYFMFSILQLTKKDALTGLLNRQAYYADTQKKHSDVTALISIDMNGLKQLNDTKGHDAGDEALSTLATCFQKALTHKQTAYRIGGDEFVILCKRTKRTELKQLIQRIRENVAVTEYSCSIGYGFSPGNRKPIDVLLKESDERMYAEKSRYYSEAHRERRH